MPIDIVDLIVHQTLYSLNPIIFIFGVPIIFLLHHLVSHSATKGSEFLKQSIYEGITYFGQLITFSLKPCAPPLR